MADITVDELREHVTTSLGDEALQRILDANQAAIDAILGPAGIPITEVQYPTGYESVLLLRHRPEPTVSPLTPLVVEGYGLTDPVTLADDDYRLDGATLRRIDFGTNPGIHFSPPVAITYAPLNDSDNRIRVLIALSRLDVTFRPGIKAMTVGKNRTEYQTAAEGGRYTDDRQALLDSLFTESLPLFG